MRPVLPEPLQPLGDLVNNLRWCWHPETQDLFESVDPDLRQECRYDPVRMHGAVSTRQAGKKSSNLIV